MCSLYNASYVMASLRVPWEYSQTQQVVAAVIRRGGTSSKYYQDEHQAQRLTFFAGLGIISSLWRPTLRKRGTSVLQVRSALPRRAAMACASSSRMSRGLFSQLVPLPLRQRRFVTRRRLVAAQHRMQCLDAADSAGSLPEAWLDACLHCLPTGLYTDENAAPQIVLFQLRQLAVPAPVPGSSHL